MFTQQAQLQAVFGCKTSTHESGTECHHGQQTVILQTMRSLWFCHCSWMTLMSISMSRKTSYTHSNSSGLRCIEARCIEYSFASKTLRLNPRHALTNSILNHYLAPISSIFKLNYQNKYLIAYQNQRHSTRDLDHNRITQWQVPTISYCTCLSQIVCSHTHP